MIRSDIPKIHNIAKFMMDVKGINVEDVYHMSIIEDDNGREFYTFNAVVDGKCLFYGVPIATARGHDLFTELDMIEIT